MPMEKNITIFFPSFILLLFILNTLSDEKNLIGESKNVVLKLFVEYKLFL